MKVAISIPDQVFSEAEKIAKKLEMSRSKLYSRALREFLARHQPDEITAAMDRAIADIEEEGDTFSEEAARRVFEHVEW